MSASATPRRAALAFIFVTVVLDMLPVGMIVQGQLQGALGSLRGIAFLLRPGIFSQTFAWFVARPAWDLPGAALLLAALFVAAALALSWRLTGRTIRA